MAVFNPFEKAMEFVFQKEGKLSNDKDDPGGITNYGIILNTLKDAKVDINGDGRVDALDIRELSPDVAVQIYKDKYWNGLNANDLDWTLAVVAFDTAVNVGVGRTNRWVQQTVDRNEDYKYLLNLRTIHYLNIIQKNPVLAKYKKGWLNRVNDLKKYVDILKEETPEQA